MADPAGKKAVRIAVPSKDGKEAGKEEGKEPPGGGDQGLPNGGGVTTPRGGKKSNKNKDGKLLPNEPEELSEEDKALKEGLELAVTRVGDTEPGIGELSFGFGPPVRYSCCRIVCVVSHMPCVGVRMAGKLRSSRHLSVFLSVHDSSRNVLRLSRLSLRRSYAPPDASCPCRMPGEPTLPSCPLLLPVRNALQHLSSEIRSATTSMTSVPKPLKFLRPHYAQLVKGQWCDRDGLVLMHLAKNGLIVKISGGLTQPLLLGGASTVDAPADNRYVCGTGRAGRAAPLSPKLKGTADINVR